MDLGIAGRTALVCGSTAGIGKACARALGEAGVALVVNGRSEARLWAAVRELEPYARAGVTGVAADVTSAAGRETLLAACPSPDILVNNAAGPPPGSWREFDEADWEAAVKGNMISPIMMMRAVLGPMIDAGWGRIITITSSAVKAPLPMLGLSNGARSGFTGYAAGLAREVARHGVTINNILPGKVETDRLHGYARALADQNGVDEGEMIRRMAAAIPAGRVGSPEELGACCAFLASERAGFVTGQNLLVDGGEYPGL
jgi:3-oxoacyl-[acyl-carrier protein] reductase